MISYDEAFACMVSAVSPLPGERVSLDAAAGRVLADPVAASYDAPRHDVSVMDGYAVRREDALGGRSLEVIGESAAGGPFEGIVAEGQAVRIFTGAHVPRGADCVVIQEETVREGNRLHCSETFGPSLHIRKRGSDFKTGDVLLAGGTHLSPPAMVALAAADCDAVTVSRAPLVSLITTGDELVAPGRASAKANAVPDTASYGVRAMASSYGGSLVGVFRGRDDLPHLKQLAAKAMVLSDLVVVIGGASVGDRDFAKPMFEDFGLAIHFSRIAIRPGKPVWFGTAGDKYVLGLPGNPASAMVTARLFLAPLLLAMQGGNARAAVATSPQRLAEDIGASGTRETFARARMSEEGLVPLGDQVSGAQAPLASSDWLIRRKPGDGALLAGATVQAMLF